MQVMAGRPHCRGRWLHSGCGSCVVIEKLFSQHIQPFMYTTRERDQSVTRVVLVNLVTGLLY